MKVANWSAVMVYQSWFSNSPPLSNSLFSNSRFSVAGRRDSRSEVSLHETPTDITVYLRIPGVAPNQIEPQILPERVVLSIPQRVEQLTLLGPMVQLAVVQRTLSLPHRVVPEQAALMIDEGALILSLPKAEPAWGNQPRSRLQQQWRSAKRWLGRQLRAASHYLLVD
ncbi:MAG: hypothetical protein F6J97_08690 [Leptolyngbya sp. SIO4C1]|nr:hypothetical protein [Leptolyngbya sp. SIO4C1]